MDKFEQRDEQVVDLGVATAETKGPIAGRGDQVGQSQGLGLSDD